MKDPLDLSMVKQKIDTSQYKSELEFYNDCMNIFQNYKLAYNDVTQVHQDAIKLSAYLTNRYQILTNQRHKSGDAETATTSSNPTTPVTKSAKSKQQQPKQAVVLPKFTDVKEKMIYLYNYINDFQIDGRDLAYPFRHLPSRTEYPDYYNIIRKPIDMTKIWHKVKQTFLQI